MERIKFKTAVVTNAANHEPFATACFNCFMGRQTSRQRFTGFCDALTTFGIPKWPLATYFWFLASRGEQMFMKPLAMQRMADSVGIPLEYRADPNWQTYANSAGCGHSR